MSLMRRSFTFAAVSAAVYVAGPACSFVLATDTAQCETDVECAARGDDFKGYICTPQKVCAKPGDFCQTDQQCIDINGGKPFLCDPTTSRCKAGCISDQQCIDNNEGKPFLCEPTSKTCQPGCSTDRQCIDANGGKPFICEPKAKQCVPGCNEDQVCTAAAPGTNTVCGPDPANPTGPKQCVEGCLSNAQCIDSFGGKHYVCRQDTRKCTSLLIPTECPQVFAGSTMPSGAGSPADLLKDDNTYLMGLVCSQGGAAGQLGPPCIEAAEMAREEFMKAGGGLPMGGKKRPLAFVNCDNNGDIKAVLNHLINNVGVKAIIGPSNSGVVSTNGPSTIQPAQVVSVTGAGGGVVADIFKNSDGFLWRAQPGDDLVVSAIPSYVKTYLEPQLRTQLGIAAGTPIRVAVATTSDAVGSGYQTYLQANLEFNGLGVVANADNFKLINYGNPADDPDTAAKQSAAAQALLTFKPHVIIFGGRGEAQTGITKPIEDGWTDPSFRPYYIYRPPVFAASGATFIDRYTDPARESLRLRSIGFTPTSKNIALRDSYVLRHKAQWDGFVHTNLPPFPGTTVSPSSLGPSITAQGFYDGAYALISAVIATGKTDPTGREISQAMAKTQPGAGASPLDIGPENVAQIQTLLSQGKTVDLNGVLTDIDFKEGIVASNAVAYCFKKAVANKTPSPVETGLVYNPTTKTFSGPALTNMTFAICPP